MLETRTEEELSNVTQKHLESKLKDAEEWENRLLDYISRVDVESEWKPFTLCEVQDTLAGMKVRASVGVGLIGVSLLREIADHESLFLHYCRRRIRQVAPGM